jgi:hypothetical protein
MQNFISDLQDHVLDRLVNPNDIGIRDVNFTDKDRRTISFISGAMYSHATLRVDYTSYDIRRARDTLNPKFKHHFIMVRSGDNFPDHPFWYAKVLGIFHLNVHWHTDSSTSATRRVDFLWVRWMQIAQLGDWERCILDRVEYVPDSSYRDMYGFLDPACVIRACHMIPAFHFGRASHSHPSIAQDDAANGDWSSYYVNRYVFIY